MNFIVKAGIIHLCTITSLCLEQCLAQSTQINRNKNNSWSLQQEILHQLDKPLTPVRNALVLHLVCKHMQPIIQFYILMRRTLPPYLWGHPLLPVGGLCLDHTLSPGSDVPSTVISITLENQLARAFLTRLKGAERYAISYTVQDLKPVKKHIRGGRSCREGRYQWGLKPLRTPRTDTEARAGPEAL